MTSSLHYLGTNESSLFNLYIIIMILSALFFLTAGICWGKIKHDLLKYRSLTKKEFYDPPI